MKFTTLFSGSRGNAAYLETEKQKILIDAGVSFSEMKRSLEAINVDIAEINAVFLSHEHSDHVFGLNELLKKTAAKAFVHENALNMMSFNTKTPVNRFSPFFEGFGFNDLYVDFYKCSHDSSCCVGYSFFDGKQKAATATDLGCADEALLKHFEKSNIVLLESNHDVEMLKNGPYPAALKRRITGKNGHLSNEQACNVLVKLPALGVKKVLLGHLSLQNNTPEMAYFVAAQALLACGMREGTDIKVDIVKQFQRSEQYDLKTV